MSTQNPKNTGQKTYTSPRYGAGQIAYDGRGKADGPGHGHSNPSNGFNRPAVSDFLGNKALWESGVYKKGDRTAPRW